MNEDMPFATSGGLAVRHRFPLDGEYVFRIRMKRNGTVSTIEGIDEDEHEIELRVDHQLVKQFTIGGKFKGPDPGVLIAVPEDDKNRPEGARLPHERRRGAGSADADQGGHADGRRRLHRFRAVARTRRGAGRLLRRRSIAQRRPAST